MTKPRTPTLEELFALVQRQGRIMNSMRLSLDIQFKRTAQLQAELDILPQARKRRATAFRALADRPADGNGDGDGHSHR